MKRGVSSMKYGGFELKCFKYYRMPPDRLFWKGTFILEKRNFLGRRDMGGHAPLVTNHYLTNYDENKFALHPPLPVCRRPSGITMPNPYALVALAN